MYSPIRDLIQKQICPRIKETMGFVEQARKRLLATENDLIQIISELIAIIDEVKPHTTGHTEAKQQLEYCKSLIEKIDGIVGEFDRFN